MRPHMRRCFGATARLGYLLFGLIWWLSACQSTPLPVEKTPPSVFRAQKFGEMDRAITEAVAEKRCPGGVFWVEQRGKTSHKALGPRAVVPLPEPRAEDA